MHLAVNSSQPTFAERVGGRWAVAPQKWAITFLLMPLLAAGYTKNLGDSRSVLLWASFGVAGLVVVGVIDVVLSRTLFRDRSVHPVPAWWVILNSACGGLLIGCFAWWGGSLGNVYDSTQMAIRIPGLVLLGAIWGVFVTLVLEYRERAVTSRHQFIDQMVQLELMKVQQSAIVDEAIQSVRDETDREIERIRSEISELAMVPAHDASAAIRMSAADAVQPLSKKLWIAAKSSYPRTRLRDVIAHSIRQQPFRPWELAVLTLGLSAIDRMVRIGVGRGLVVSMAITVGIVVQLKGANKALLTWPHFHRGIFIGTIGIVEVQTIAIVIWERQVIAAPVSYVEVVASVAASLFLIFLTVGIRSLDLISGEVVRFAQEGVNAERIAAIARDRQIGAALREMAQTLHGTVQTRLVSCAMALDLAAQAGDDESANAALLEARRVLETATEQREPIALSIEEEVKRKVDVWTGLCDVTVQIGVVTVSNDIVNRVGRIVEEGIANAVRHGGARNIDVIITQDPDDTVVIQMVDDGCGPTGGARGVGSAIIDLATGGLWNLTPSGPGSVLSATVQPV